MKHSKLETTAVSRVKVNHIINKTASAMKQRPSYSSNYMKSFVITAEQSIDKLWWSLQTARVGGLLTRYCAEVPLRMVYGDQHEAHSAEISLSRIGLMCLQVANNLKMSSVAIFLLQLATEFGYTVPDLVRKLISLFSNVSLCSTQLYQNMRGAVLSFLTKWGIVSESGEVAEDPIGVIQAEQSFIDLDETQTTAVAGVMGGVAVILAAGFAGVSDYTPNKGFLKSIAEFGGKAAKMKNGLYAILACVKDFSAFVKECVMNYYGSTPADSVVKAIDSLKYQFDGEPIKTEELFDALKDLNTPEGEEKMSVDLEAFRKGTAVSTVFSRVISGQIANAFAIPTGTVALLSTTLRTFEQRLKSAAVKQNMGEFRFTPFCIWIAGDPGKGKSVALGKMTKLIMNALLEEDALKYGVPQEDQWLHSANFTQEYHTGYNGQYVFQIDDMCQDKPGTLKTSSALQFIQWVSNIPANVTQAALEDKKCPFRSKIIGCTSNSLYPNRTHEIESNEAFLRRRHVVLHATPATEKDPDIGWPVKFTLCDPKDQTAVKTTFNRFYDVVEYVLDKFKEHHEEQTALVDMVRNERAEDFLRYMRSKNPLPAVQSCYPVDPDLSQQRMLQVEEIAELQPEPLEDHMIEYWLDNPVRDCYIFDWRREDGPGVQITGVIAPESWAAQDQLMSESEYRYNLMQTVMNTIPLPVYHFSAGCLVRADEAEITLSPIDARRVELMRDWHRVEFTLTGSYQFLFNNYAETDGVIEAEQSFWTEALESVREKMPTMEDFHGACKKSADTLRKVWETIYESSIWWKVLAGLGSVVGMYFAYCSYGESNSWRDVCDAEASYDHAVGRGRPVAQASAVPSYNHEVGRSRATVKTIQAVQSSFVQSVFHKNVVELRWPQGALNGIFVKGTTLLTCGHFFRGAEPGAKFTVVKYPKYAEPVEVEVVFDPKRLVKIPDAEDSVLYHVGSVIDSFRDISTKFCSGLLPDYMDAAVTSVYPEPEVVIGPVSVFTENQVVEFKAGINHNPNKDERPVCRIVKGFNMQGYHRRGKSGSPLIADEKVNRTPTIFGLQSCINEKMNLTFFEALTKQQIASALGQVEAEQSMFTEADDRWDQEDDEAWFDAPEEVQKICAKSLEFIGPVKQKVHQATETKLRMSVVAPFFDPLPDTKKFLPAVLRDREVDILTKSMAGYSRKYGTVDPVLLRSTVDQFIIEDRTVRRHAEKRLLDRDEVLNGLHGQGLKGLDMKTSAGIPLVFEKEKGKDGKMTWMTMGDDHQRTMNDATWKLFEDAERDLRSGKMISLTSYACLKDELRTEEKIVAKKTRSFIVLPLIFNMLIRKYFGQWIARQHQLAGTISSAVGIDANSDWTALKKRLCAMGQDIEDFDYTDWDRSLHPEWFAAYAERVSAWYADKRGSPEWIVRELLMRQLVFMNIQVGDWLLRTHGGNKSGCAITAEINTDIHDMLTYYVWTKICQETGRREISSLPHFRERVALALYGDDMLKATRSDVTSWFNGTAMKAKIEELGMHITPGDKDETKGFRIRRIDEVTFLKRRFLSFDGDGGRVRAPLDKSVIQRMVLWIHKSDSAIDATRMNIQGALREAFFWGEDFFRDFTKRCEDSWARSKCAHVPFPQVYYQSVLDAWNYGHGDMMPGLFQFRVVPGPAMDAEEGL